LQDYIKASTIAIEIIPRHKDWIDIQANKGEAYRMYQMLTKRLSSQHQKFAEVKKLIKEDNLRTGVQPTKDIAKTPYPTSGTVNGHTRSQSVQHEPLSNLSNGNHTRQKPPIQPKPNALHGNALPTGQMSDLAARFAGLRSGTNGKVQDPRIRTQSIPGIAESSLVSTTQVPLPKPSGPREMPPVPTTVPGAAKLPPLDVQIPNLPRAPDAIYSPAQNADTPATANLLSSVQRGGSFSGSSRQNSAPPISTYIPTPKIRDNGGDYFSPGPPLPPKKVVPSIPDSTTVTAEDLMTYLSYGSASLKVLLVDVRSRDEFESGHILAQAIICVEPITLRPDISAEQLGDSMIIAPDGEQALYEQRHDYDLIVYYDQSSESLQETDPTLLHFSKAIYDYEYDQRPQRHPMLLVGGLDAWTDLLGPNSLQASISRTSSPAPDSFGKPGRPIGRVPPARKPPGAPLRRKKTYSSRPLSKDEEKKWGEILRRDSVLVKEETITEEEEETASADFVYAKTAEDFFRRFPDVSTIQESMITPLPREKRIDSVSSAPAVPEPPARPAPALPRQYSSGLFEKGPIAVASPSHAHGITKSRRPQGLTGLNNSGVTCYLNSAIQAISATPFLRETLMQFSQSRSPVPRKSDEDPTAQPPQFLTKTLQNLLTHLWSGNQDFLKPTTFAVSEI
jgi:ubiquitin carboxyl-terminal hydrolase 8